MQLWRFDLRGMLAALGHLTGRVMWYSFVQLLFLIGFYFLGNTQEFLDSTQLILLRLMELSAIIATGSGAYYFIYSLIRFVIHDRTTVVSVVLNLAIVGFSAAMVLSSMFLLVWFQ